MVERSNSFGFTIAADLGPGCSLNVEVFAGAWDLGWDGRVIATTDKLACQFPGTGRVTVSARALVFDTLCR
jgi:hypothetical protein